MCNNLSVVSLFLSIHANSVSVQRALFLFSLVLSLPFSLVPSLPHSRSLAYMWKHAYILVRPFGVAHSIAYESITCLRQGEAVHGSSTPAVDLCRGADPL